MITPREIGYSGAGTVLAVGDDVEGIQMGQTVAYAATGHAEVAARRSTTSCRFPTRSTCATALRHRRRHRDAGLRRADVRFGEVVAIYGLGLVGQICARIATRPAGRGGHRRQPEGQRARACDAGASLAVDPSDPEWKRQILDFTGKQGVDATIVCASSDSSEIINSSMEITRRQGRVSCVGYVKLDIHPKHFLYREIDLRYSRVLRAWQLSHRLREGPAGLPVRVRALDREAQPGGIRPTHVGPARSTWSR